MFKDLRNKFLTLYCQKKFIVSSAFVCCVFSVLLLSYKSGPAKNGIAVTGAPFNSSQTCSNCHSGGAFGGSVKTQLLDSTNKVVKTYVPGHSYSLKIFFSKTSTATTRYGFQTTAATSVGSKNINKWGTLPANTHNTLLSARNYVEQSTALATATIKIPWTGPVKGTGSVKFYTSGNIVNNDGGTSGDQPVSAAALAITEGVALMPVTLSNINANAQNNTALISWSTENENKVHSYVIEKSINNINFTEVGTVMSKGDGDYNFTDPSFKGKVYYRIKVKDVAGVASYSELLTVATPDSKNYKLSLYNHAGYAYIMFSNGSKAQKVQVTYTDMQGRALTTGTTYANEGDNIWEIPKTKIKGMAIINVVTEDGIRTSLKFIAN